MKLWTAKCASCDSEAHCDNKSDRDDWTILHMNATGHAVRRSGGTESSSGSKAFKA